MAIISEWSGLFRYLCGGASGDGPADLSSTGYLTLPGKLRSPDAMSNTSVTQNSGAWTLAFTFRAAVTPS